MTLVELLIVMALLLIVIGALADGFVSVTRAEVDQSNRADDQQRARQALDQMRRDIHCASSADQPQAEYNNPLDTTQVTGYIITLNEPSNGCPGVTSGSTAGVQWCTNLISTGRYQLYRSTVSCDSADATFEVDYVTQADIWPWPSSCTVGQIPTVGVDLTVNRDETTQPGRTYTLADTIAMRNAQPYQTTSCT